MSAPLLPISTWLSVRAAARALRIPRSGVLGLIRNGPLPGFRFGSRIKVRAQDLLAFLPGASR